MTILRLKNPNNIYRIDAKKLGGERGYLAPKDLRIKSRFSRSNVSIREVGRSGERKTQEGEERRGRTLGEEGWAGLNAGGSAPFTLAPSQGSISEILSARGLFVRNF